MRSRRPVMAFLVVAILVTACGPRTKEQYLDSFEAFVLEVRQGHRTFDEQDWARRDRDFDRYSDVYYRRFTADLDTGDRARIARLEIVYHLYRGDWTLTALMAGAYNEQIGVVWDELRAVIGESARLYLDVREDLAEILAERWLQGSI